MHEQTAPQIYDGLLAKGEYKETDKNLDLIRKIIRKSSQRKKYIDFLLQQKIIDWEVIYTLYYDVLRALGEAFLIFDGVKINNHQGCFAYLCVKFPELELDWNFFEKIRSTRNRNKYEAGEISPKDWKEIEIQVKLYISTIEKELEGRL